jgi:hypothetical protein
MSTVADRSFVDALARVLKLEQEDFLSLVKASGLDPAKDFVHADLRGLDLRDLDLRAFDLSDAQLGGANVANTLFNATVSPDQLLSASGATVRSSTVLKLPRRFGTTSDRLQQTLEYLATFRALFANAGSDLVVDASECENMSPSGALLLKAEMEGHAKERPLPKIRFVPPTGSSFRAIGRLLFGDKTSTSLTSGQFYFSQHVWEGGIKWAPIPPIIDATTRRYGNLRLSSSLEQAMREVISNVFQHAYADPSKDYIADGRIWVASAYFRKRLFIGILDHGSGIIENIQNSITGPPRFLRSYSSRAEGVVDERLEFADLMSAKGALYRDRGLHLLPDFIHKHVAKGGLQVMSGDINYVLRKASVGAVPIVHVQKLKTRFAGTMVALEISAPAIDP